ncbi:MAG: hypothetical protein FJ388_11710, partial [Verrucomicrobia bacterium]|nr:hypothetical protein [Verrucomicrobiota bacterium]
MRDFGFWICDFRLASEATSGGPVAKGSLNRSEWLLLAVTVAAAFAIALFEVNDFDIWFHLKGGEHIVQTRAIPWVDPFSYTATHPWVYHSWLSGVAFHLLYAAGGWVALLSYKAGVIALAGWTLLRTVRRAGVPMAVACPLLVFVLYAVRFRLDMRPHVHTALFL